MPWCTRLLFICVAQARVLAAQDTATPAVPHRDRLAVSAGLITAVPGQGDRGAGPFVGLTLRTPMKKEGRRWLLGVAYGIVFTRGWTSPEGEHYSFAPEGIIGTFGREWALGEQEQIGFDLQWNPSVSTVRRWGAMPEWRQGPSPWTSKLAVGSAGLRLTLPNERGPVVSIAGRFYVDLNPLALAYGAINPSPAIGVSIQPR